MSEVVLTVKKLSIMVKGKPFLENIDFNVNKGDYLAISGIGGSGKSLLIKALLGLVTKDVTGEILYRGIGKNEVTYIPQSAQQPAKDEFLGSAKEIIAIGLFSKKKGLCLDENDWKKVDDILDTLDLSDVKDKKINKLPQWQQYKVKIATSLISEPKVIFIDTPVSSTNTKAKNELYKILNNICKKENITIIHIIEDIKGISPYADNLLYLNKKEKSFYYGNIKDFSLPTKEDKRKEDKK